MVSISFSKKVSKLVAREKKLLMGSLCELVNIYLVFRVKVNYNYKYSNAHFLPFLLPELTWHEYTQEGKLQLHLWELIAVHRMFKQLKFEQSIKPAKISYHNSLCFSVKIANLHTL